jgi:hypothetical protein
LVRALFPELAVNSQMDATDRQNSRRRYFLGASQGSVTALSITCRCSLLHCGQLKVRRSWPNAPGSIAVNFIGDPHAVHCGPWFCLSSMGCLLLSG